MLTWYMKYLSSNIYVNETMRALNISGSLGDCWMLAPMSTISEKPDLFKVGTIELTIVVTDCLYAESGS